MSEDYLEIKVGEIYRIPLQSNQTTGFCWTLKSVTGNVSVSDEYKHKASALLGASGEHFWYFTPNEKGTHRIILSYERSLAPGVNNTLRTFYITAS